MNVEGETPYRCEQETERLQIYFTSMARAHSEKGSTKSFYDLNVGSDCSTGASILALSESIT